MQRSTRTILSETYSELQAREATLVDLRIKVSAELYFARAAMIAVDGLLRGQRVSLSTNGTRTVMARPTGDLKRMMLGVVREWGDLISREELADATGVYGRGLQIVIGQAIAAGELIEIPSSAEERGGLGIPSSLLEPDDV